MEFLITCCILLLVISFWQKVHGFTAILCNVKLLELFENIEKMFCTIGNNSEYVRCKNSLVIVQIII